MQSEESQELSVFKGVRITRCGHIKSKDQDTARLSRSSLCPKTTFG